jgi:peroxiredoxin
VSQLRQDYQQFQDLGVEIVVVTMGNPEQTTDFWQTYRLPFPGLCDPEQRAYQTYSLPDGDIRLLAGPGILGKTFVGFFKHGVSKPIGSGLQMPGVFIIDQQGIVLYNHPYQSSADNPPNSLILQKLADLKLVMGQSKENADTP